MKLKLIFAFLTLMFILTKPSYSDVLNDAQFEFSQGNIRYSAGEYEQAITNYEKALSFGFESGPLYYNLANAYFKSGSLGKAVLNYIRAQRLIPNDADLISNLNYARSRIKGGGVSAQRSWLMREFFKLASSFSLDKITSISFGLYLILSVLIILIILLKDLRKVLTYISVAAAVLLAAAFSIFLTQFNRVVIQKEAIVVAEAADSKFEPLDEATTFFSLSEGEDVLVVTTKAGWVKIKRPDGKQGWVKKVTVEQV
ncbi:MAG: tetratricopeptide repeat protein [Candidatus Omnitrophota bacterium]